MRITLVFNSSQSAETAWIEYFEEPSEVCRATLNRKDGKIEIEVFHTAQIHLEIPDGAIAIVI